MAYSTRCSDTAVRWRTSPDGSTTAENPVGAACNTHRPDSMARSRLLATCWDCTRVREYDAPLVGLSTISPPAATPSRTRRGKKTSQLITVAAPTVAPSAKGRSTTAVPVPGTWSRPGSSPPPIASSIGSISGRNGTYSPKGTRRSLS
ncbi:MAG: hypothetical protein R2704_01640 [Microthrixaceae bacterium]